ncbi:MAG: hypothetical protein WCT18_02540 [Patescibacteria group bacterium]
MKSSLKTGLSFGLTSGTITTLGLMIGLLAGTNSKLAVLAGILTIAIADALSDALGMHISTESNKHNTNKEVWITTFATFFAKLFFATTFIIPILIFPLKTAAIISVIYGLLLITIFSYSIAKAKDEKPFGVILEHSLITVLVIVATYFVGDLINTFLK